MIKQVLGFLSKSNLWRFDYSTSVIRADATMNQSKTSFWSGATWDQNMAAQSEPSNYLKPTRAVVSRSISNYRRGRLANANRVSRKSGRW